MSASSVAQTNKPLLSDQMYIVLKNSATVVLPAIGTLYFALAQIWDFPKAEEVVGSIAALNTFIGVVVGMSTRSYNKSGAKYVGDLEVVQDPHDVDKTVYSLNLNGDPEDLQALKEVTFKVQNQQ
jgi:imidazoleglycerol phosphate synthase glutamine amidotransferase subunit HisH